LTIDDAYVELGLVPGASETQVKAAWRRLVSHWHPDRNPAPGAAASMQRINAAYERIRLTLLGEAGDGRATAASSGRTLRRRVRLTLEEAALGCLRVLRGRLVDPCAACAGAGIAAQAATCAFCHGSGSTRTGLWFGWLGGTARCTHCEGAGSTQRACAACEGSGRLESSYRRQVRLPAGVRHGDVLSADGAGSHRGGFDGTLELQIDVTPHRFFAPADDGSVRCEMPVDGFAWLAEAWVDVPTLGGAQQMRLRRGRLVYRLRGQGLPLERGGRERGDAIVTVLPTFPDSPSPRQQALLEQLAATADPGAAAPLRDWQRTLHDWERSRHRPNRA